MGFNGFTRLPHRFKANNSSINRGPSGVIDCEDPSTTGGRTSASGRKRQGALGNIVRKGEEPARVVRPLELWFKLEKSVLWVCAAMLTVMRIRSRLTNLF